MTTDSGWAWVVLAACSGSHFLNGILAYFVGVVHAGLLRKFQSSVTTTAWVGAIYISLMALGAPLASVVISRFGCRVCCVVGGVLCFTGFTASAFVTSIEQLFFTYGLLAGLGLSFTYSPTNITMGFYFHKYLGLASGIAGGCGAVGILSGSLIVQTLIEEFSISGAFLLTGALSLHHSLFAMFYRPTRYEGKVKRVSWTVEAPQVQEEKHGSTFSLALHGLEVRTPSLCSVSISEVNTRLGHRPTTEQEMPLLKTKGKDGQLDLKTSGETCAEGQSAKSVVKSTGDLFDKQKERTTASTENIFHISRAPISNKPGNGKDAHTQTSHSFENGVNGCTKKSAFEGLHGVCSSVGGFHGQQSQGHTENRLTGILTVTDDYTSELVIKCDTDRSGNLTHKTNSPRSRVQTVLKSVGVHLELFTNKSFLLHCAGFAAANIHISGTQLHLPEYAMQNGTTPTQAAALFVAVGTLWRPSLLIDPFLMQAFLDSKIM
nr:hypothetical protein BaRGS_021197 [Batillaria attramentaria]